MATIIQVGENRFIAGDPDTILQPGSHWCECCGGDGLDYGIDDDLTICGMCVGFGQVACNDPECTHHAH